MRMRGIISTTHVDSHNTRMSKEALVNAAEQINGDEVPGVGIDHDVLIPPIGKVVRAEIVKLDDGEFGLYAEQEIFEEKNTTIVSLPSGEIAYLDQWKDDRPFLNKCVVAPEKIEVLYDPVNFESDLSVEYFVKDLNEDKSIQIPDTKLLRKSFIPDPELIIHLSNKAIELLIAHQVFKRVGKQITDDISNDLSNVYASLRNTAIKYAKYCIPKNRPVTFIIVVPGTTTIECIIRTTDMNHVFEAITTEQMTSVISATEVLDKSFNAQKIQFHFDENNKWAFNYLLTKDGKVIGSEVATKRRAKAVELRLQDMDIQASIQGKQTQ